MEEKFKYNTIEEAIAAIKAGKNIALANKETLVIAGDIVMNLAKENKVTIFPIDSEHSAIFQLLNSHNQKDINKIINHYNNYFLHSSNCL